MKLMKPKFWDYKKPNFLSYFLLPLTFPIIINNFFSKKIIDTPSQKIKKVCIGNIYVGGTAKTPLTIKIYKILKNLKYKTATIKKYYKDQIDEQQVLDSKTILYCAKKRSEALDQAIKNNIDIVVFDDGLQDRSISYDLKIVCFNNIKWIEAMGDYIKIVTQDNNYVVLSSMKAFISRLPENQFMRIHKSYIINIKKVINHNNNNIFMDGKLLPLSRNQKLTFRENFTKYQ